MPSEQQHVWVIEHETRYGPRPSDDLCGTYYTRAEARRAIKEIPTVERSLYKPHKYIREAARGRK